MGRPSPECRSRLTFDRSPVRESRTPGSARGAGGNSCPYRDRRVVPADADRDATLRRMRAAAREGAELCLRPSPTAIGPVAYGHRLQTRQDFSGLVGCVLRRRCLRRRGTGGTRGHGGRRHPVDPLRAEAAVDRSGAAQGHHGDLVRRVLRYAASACCATSRSARSTRCSPGGPGLVCGAGCSTA
jgi:hypothetical protein